MRQYLNDFVVERETATGARPRVYVTEGTTFNVSCFRDQVRGLDCVFWGRLMWWW